VNARCFKLEKVPFFVTVSDEAGATSQKKELKQNFGDKTHIFVPFNLGLRHPVSAGDYF